MARINPRKVKIYFNFQRHFHLISAPKHPFKQLIPMEQPPAQTHASEILKDVICKHCCERFESKGKYQVHYRHNHQEEARSNDVQPGEGSFRRDRRGRFSCPCGKSYTVWQNLNRHTKDCIEWRDRTDPEIASGDTEEGTISLSAG